LYSLLEEFLAPPSGLDTATISTMTIHDVAVDGTFPADGYPERLRRWARSIVSSRPCGRSSTEALGG
jgi:hypothetical protein